MKEKKNIWTPNTSNDHDDDDEEKLDSTGHSHTEKKTHIHTYTDTTTSTTAIIIYKTHPTSIKNYQLSIKYQQQSTSQPASQQQQLKNSHINK